MKPFFSNSLVIFINAILAGVFIGIAGTVYLSVPNAVVGAILFGFGLMTILLYGFKLYTGAIGYLVEQGRDSLRYLWQLAVIWLGNLCGCFIVGTLVRNCRTFNMIKERVLPMCETKLADSWGSLLILAFFCGILMYTAVETYHRSTGRASLRRQEISAVFRIAAVFLCVSIFILCGFEHCIADMYYFTAAGVWSWKTLGVTLLLTFGNALGGWLLPVSVQVLRKLKTVEGEL